MTFLSAFLAQIIWDVSPIIVEIGPLSLRWYGLLFAGSFYAGYLIMNKIFLREGLTTELLDKLTIYMVIGTVAGARVGHCLFYDPAYYLANPIDILKVWEGGLASHGAAIGILLAMYYFTKNTAKRSFLWILDRIVIVVALSGLLIRAGNLFNSEIIGSATNVPWAFIFTSVDDIPRHPSQIYEGLAYFAIFVFLVFIYRKTKGNFKEGLLFSIFLISVFAFRFIVEFFKKEQVAFEQSMLLNMGQILSIPLVLAGIILLYFSLTKSKKTYPDNQKFPVSPK